MKHLTLDESVKMYSEAAVHLAQQLGINLDYTNESVEKLEQILDLCYKQAQKNSIDERQYIEKANIFGCYLGNTLIKNLKEGVWETEPVNQALGIKIKTEYIFFPAKVYRRLKNGSDENVVSLYLSIYNNYAKSPISLKVFIK